MKTDLKKLFVPLNIQMFADGDDNNDNADEEDKTDYKALYEKAKAEKDKASKEASDYKKQLREKQSDDEKKLAEEKEKQEEIAKIISENKRLRLTNALSEGGVLTAEEIATIAELRGSEDDAEFAKSLLKVISDKVEKAKADLTAEFKKNPKLPNGSNGESSQSTDLAKKIAKAKSGNQSKSFDKYFNN